MCADDDVHRRRVLAMFHRRTRSFDQRFVTCVLLCEKFFEVCVDGGFLLRDGRPIIDRHALGGNDDVDHVRHFVGDFIQRNYLLFFGAAAFRIACRTMNFLFFTSQLVFEMIDAKEHGVPRVFQPRARLAPLNVKVRLECKQTHQGARFCQINELLVHVLYALFGIGDNVHLLALGGESFSDEHDDANRKKSRDDDGEHHGHDVVQGIFYNNASLFVALHWKKHRQARCGALQESSRGFDFVQAI